MKLPFCLVSKAYSPSTQEPPVEGVRNFAALAHSLKLPVTWIVEPRGCETLRTELAEWHSAHGDEIAMSLFDLPVSADAYQTRRDQLKALCPWSEVTISGQGGNKSGAMIRTLESAGIEGHWGYCWEQTFVDNITDFGQPPGLFFASPESYKMPRADSKPGVVAIEWLSRDLNKAFWTGNPVHFAGEPDAFAVMGDWPEEESLAYFSHLVEQYSRNARTGQAIPYIFQEESEQLMERLGKEYASVWPRLISWMERALSPLAGSPEIEFTTLPRLARQFRGGDWTWPRLYRASDRSCLPLHDPRDGRTRSRIYGASFKFPETLHYCSLSMFATFQAGNPLPIRLIRYDRQQSCDVLTPLAAEERLPQLLALGQRNGSWEATLRSDQTFPFALCLPLADGDEPTGNAPVNEDGWAWEFVVQPGIATYTSPPVRRK